MLFLEKILKGIVFKIVVYLIVCRKNPQSPRFASNVPRDRSHHRLKSPSCMI